MAGEPRHGRVVGVREDGGLVTAPIAGRDEHGAEALGTPIQLPPEYVAEHVALGYASTIHAAQGRTVDVCYTVAGPGTSRDSLYVSMSRGRGDVAGEPRHGPGSRRPGGRRPGHRADHRP